MNLPVNPWPHWTDSLLAKSADRSVGDEPETLAEHTWLVLARLSDQYRLRPGLSQAVADPRLWHRLYWGCFLHDFGKVAAGFQRVLRGKQERWPQRHEVLSLAFVNWLFPAGHPDRLAVISVVVSHHKEPDELYERYLAQTAGARESLSELAAEVIPEEARLLYRWIDECGLPWAEALGMVATVKAVELLPIDDALAHLSTASIRAALEEFDQLALTYDGVTGITVNSMRDLILRGLVLTADHSASAHAPGFPSLELAPEKALPPGTSMSFDDLYDHQNAAAQSKGGSALLIAPTGRGKTEAGLLWAVRQAAIDEHPPPRLFYALPYQASMNAMYGRLRRHFPNPGGRDFVGLQHSRAVQSMYHDLMIGASDETRQQIEMKARRKRNLADLGFYPLRVFSPYQMLKAAYTLRGFEAMLLDYHDGLFIFDEIHAYQPKRLALIVELMRWLAVHFGARFMVMTATLPPTVDTVLKRALPDCQVIRASEQDFRQSQRHIVTICAGDLLSDQGMRQVSAAFSEGQSVLVCANTVDRSIQAYRTLQNMLPGLVPDEDIILLHGRFSGEDRDRKEAAIIRRAGVERTDRGPILVVATQVVEVSLNIDLDTIYSDPAPLEALIQRFGRVNRGRGAGAPLAPVHVFTELDAGSYIYDEDLVSAGMAVLVDWEGRSIDEAQVGSMLARVYADERQTAWQAEYDQSANEFNSSVLRLVRPFQTLGQDIMAKFYELFDGIDVLPEASIDRYDTLIRDGFWIEAQGLFVSMGFGQYQSLSDYTWEDVNDYGRVRYHAVSSDVPYDPETGLDLAAVRGK